MDDNAITDAGATAEPQQNTDAPVSDFVLPPCGDALTRVMAESGITDEASFCSAALYMRVPIRILGKKDDPENPHHGLQATLLPGHYLTTPLKLGPQDDIRCRVMVVGRNPTYYDQLAYELFTDDTRDTWVRVLEDAGIGRREIYVTNLVRFVPPKYTKSIKATWVKECLRLLHEEVLRVKPDIIIAMGRDVAVAMFGRGTTLSSVRGDTRLTFLGVPTLVTVHTGVLSSSPEMMTGFLDDIRTAAAMAADPTSLTSQPVDIVRLTTPQELREAVDLCMAAEPEWLSVDCEWGSMTKSDYIHGQLRSIQFAWETHRAFVVVLRKEGLEPVFAGGEPAALPELKRLLETSGARLCGHAFRADQKFLEAIGVDCKAWEHGFDTMLGYHRLKPYADGFGLEELSIRHTDLGRYDIPVATWLKANGFNKTRLNQHGYAFVPEELLTPYSAKDVLVVIRCVPWLIGELQAVKLGTPYELNGERIESMYDVYRHLVHPATLALNEIETAGVYTDYDKLLAMIRLYIDKKTKMQAEFVSEAKGINWPEFNFRSVDHVREFLFGEQPRKGRLRPEGAKSLGATPVKTTEKPPRNWDTAPRHAIAAGHVSPSTDGETLLILGAAYLEATALKRLRTVDQVVKNFLRPADNADEDDVTDDELVFSGGLAACVDEDMRIRTRIGQLTNSGRYTSSSPNLMNPHNKVEPELRRIFALDEAALLATKEWASLPVAELKTMGLLPQDYYAIRSCFMAPPGYVLIDADFVQAELFVIAHLSGDDALLEVLYDKTRDLHSEMAINAFHLTCGPKEVKKLHPNLRIAAKAVVYGILYGRSAAAIARQLQAEGIQITVDEAQSIVDTLFRLFPRVYEYIQRCKAAVYNQGYLETAWGFRRYFFPTGDRGLDAALEREAVNHPIQGTVAGCLDLAVANFRQYKRHVEPDLDFQVVLPVHDAVLIYARPWDVPRIREVVIPTCMTWGTTIPTLGLSLQTDIEVKLNWDDRFTDDEVDALLAEMTAAYR